MADLIDHEQQVVTFDAEGGDFVDDGFHGVLLLLSLSCSRSRVPWPPRTTPTDGHCAATPLSRAEQLPVTVAIWLGEQRVFHSAQAGSSADNDKWVDRKPASSGHFAKPSAEVQRNYASDGIEGFLPLLALPIDSYFPAGGAVTLVVRGTMVGVLAISGLQGTEDHDLAVQVLKEFGQSAQ